MPWSVNTRFWRGQAEPTETLRAPEDLAGWTAAMRGPRVPSRPRRDANSEHADRAARDAGTGLFDPKRRTDARARDLEALEPALAAAPARTALQARAARLWLGRARCRRRCAATGGGVWVGAAGATFLARPAARSVRRCANPDAAGCSSRQPRGSGAGAPCRARRYRAKARRHYHRERERLEFLRSTVRKNSGAAVAPSHTAKTPSSRVEGLILLPLPTG